VSPTVLLQERITGSYYTNAAHSCKAWRAAVNRPACSIDGADQLCLRRQPNPRRWTLRENCLLLLTREALISEALLAQLRFPRESGGTGRRAGFRIERHGFPESREHSITTGGFAVFGECRFRRLDSRSCRVISSRDGTPDGTPPRKQGYARIVSGRFPEGLIANRSAETAFSVSTSAERDSVHREPTNRRSG
jgi:hypothetical protein